MWISIKSSCSISNSIDRAANSLSTPIQNMGIYHGRFYILVAKQLLDGPDVITVLKQMVGVRMMEAQGFTEAFQEFRFLS
jgi:hypothetical protein